MKGNLLPIMTNETKVYIADTKVFSDDSFFNKMYNTVSAERQEKIDHLQQKKDKNLSLAAEVLLKKALLELGISDCEISHNPNGKPYVKNREDVFISLSHSHERVMCAVSSLPVGCDAEKSENANIKIAERFFCNSEYDAIIQKATPEEQQKMFFRLWTLKESFIKATGLGKKLSLNSFGFEIKDGEITITQSVNQNKYYFKEFDFNDGYSYSVCSMCPDICELKQVILK